MLQRTRVVLVSILFFILISVSSVFFISTYFNAPPQGYARELRFHELEQRGIFQVLEEEKVSSDVKTQIKIDESSGNQTVTLIDANDPSIAVKVDKQNIWRKKGDKWCLRISDYATSQTVFFWGPHHLIRLQKGDGLRRQNTN